MIVPRTLEVQTRKVSYNPRFDRMVSRPAFAAPSFSAVKIGAGGGSDEWSDRLCARAAAAAAANCGPMGQGCQPVLLGIPQGSASGVIATTAAATFTLVVPVNFVPNRLILSGASASLNVTDIHAALGGPMVFGSSTSPIPGSLFAADIERHVQLQSYIVTAGQSLFVSVVNPTASSLVFTGAFEGIIA